MALYCNSYGVLVIVMVTVVMITVVMVTVVMVTAVIVTVVVKDLFSQQPHAAGREVVSTELARFYTTLSEFTQNQQNAASDA
jgi:flagellar basal body-associated protein FliL